MFGMEVLAAAVVNLAITLWIITSVVVLVVLPKVTTTNIISEEDLMVFIFRAFRMFLKIKRSATLSEGSATRVLRAAMDGIEMLPSLTLVQTSKLLYQSLDNGQWVLLRSAKFFLITIIK